MFSEFRKDNKKLESPSQKDNILPGLCYLANR